MPRAGSAAAVAKDVKPAYRVPSMTEIVGIPLSGLTAVSTFSGCGGSSLGCRMAGFRGLWASEFVEAARETYAANFPGVHVDDRDIRDVQPEDILDSIGMLPGDLDLFEGSPPCASFSTAGKRSEHWGREKKYSDVVQRTDDLFWEYARLLKGLQPRAFIAENVSGLVKGVAKGYFIEILALLKDCGYRVACRVLDAQWLGVPQERKRCIFIGVRDDLPADILPTHPSPLAYRYSVREAIPWIVDGSPHPVEDDARMDRFATGRQWDEIAPGEQSDKYFQLVKPDVRDPCPTVTAEGGNAGLASVCHPTERRKFTIAELKRICAFPDDFVLTGSYAQRWERLGRAVPPVMMFHIARTVRDAILFKADGVGPSQEDPACLTGR